MQVPWVYLDQREGIGLSHPNVYSSLIMLKNRLLTLLVPSALLTTALFADNAATAVKDLFVKEGFAVELLYSVPKEEQGSWVSICTDPKGRLIVSDQYGALYRFAPPAAGATLDPATIEKIDLPIGQAHGLLYAFDSLYCMVANDVFEGRGLYRLQDTDGDDTYDKVTQIVRLEGGGEHGPHHRWKSDGTAAHAEDACATRLG